ELVDTAGLHDTGDAIDVHAQRLGQALAEQADLVIWCLEAGTAAAETGREWERFRRATTPTLRVATKTDLLPALVSVEVLSGGFLATSARTGAGLSELRQHLAERARQRQT